MLLFLSTAQAAPNIVILISDDMGWGDVGYNDSEIATPAIDRLADEGMQLDRFYVQPACTPTRTTLMTGRLPHRTGAYTVSNPWYERGLSPDEKFLPEYFRDAGYQTHGVGKWHLGPNEAVYRPLNRGFESFYGHIHGYINHYLHSIYGRTDWQRDGVTVHEEGYSTHLIAAEAVRAIHERDRDRPLFLYVSFSAPHAPLQAPAMTVAEYSDIDDPNRQIYAAMVTELDRGIAAIRSTLEAEGIEEETLLLFFSDNGGVPSLGASNAPLRGTKGQTFEGGIRVPGLIYWPEQLDPSVFAEHIAVADLLPTLASAAAIDIDPPRPIDGHDMWKALSEGAPAPNEARFVPHLGVGEDALSEELQFAYFSGVWKLVRARNQTRDLQLYLFDIRSDPSEQNDMAASHPDVAERLLAEVEALPRVQSWTVDEGPEGPSYYANLSLPGGPIAAEPDNRIPTATPYAESGPVSWYPDNWAAPENESE